ncbi:hypothetical protein [Usitatibacter palustris]|uniref:LTXXQ motif family protein n=1 Tax=Usitatibacter palustris TaxID=2732487 RepID=A0A6M4H9Q9_9PROT|nr:hypothetical protein [Usitatibacter palustris]QJR15453.1 hypothetical protein DSM104440_02274 [Usitatibacter palustris]
MNKTLTTVLAAAMLAALPAAAQDKKAPPPAPAAAPDKAAQFAKPEELRMKIQSDKKGIVERNLGLTGAESVKFWPVYDAFQKELAGPQSEINRAVIDYVGMENAITDANAKRLVDQILAAESKEAKIRAEYFIKAQKVLGAKKAARYMQIENKIRAILRYETVAAIPLVH